MQTLRVACLITAFVVAGAHAETCSGGADGGMDDTGNQCTAPENDRDAAQAALALMRVAATPSRPPVDRSARFASPQGQAMSAARSAAPGEATCSGGPSGGSDATGNQCSLADFAERVAGL